MVLKKLEKNDITKTMIPDTIESEETERLSEVEEIIAETDLNSVTPMQALTLLMALKEKVNK